MSSEKLCIHANSKPSFALRATEGRQIRMRIRTLLTGVTKIPKFKMSYHEDTD